MNFVANWQRCHISHCCQWSGGAARPEGRQGHHHLLLPDSRRGGPKLSPDCRGARRGQRHQERSL